MQQKYSSKSILEYVYIYIYIDIHFRFYNPNKLAQTICTGVTVNLMMFYPCSIVAIIPLLKVFIDFFLQKFTEYLEILICEISS